MRAYNIISDCISIGCIIYLWWRITTLKKQIRKLQKDAQNGQDI